MSESQLKKSLRLKRILKNLRKTYHPKEEDFVVGRTPFELLIATVLSAQCTDKQVNRVTPTLFFRFSSPKHFAKATLGEIERFIRPTGFYKTKARYLRGIGRAIIERYGGVVPSTKSELMTLPGVGHKTANLVMSKAFGQPTGVVVDTHVRRIASRLQLTRHHDPQKIAADLERLLPPNQWLALNEYLILHGRAICVARFPKCRICALYNDCPEGRKRLGASER